ncbi:MAG: hypothetical protein EA412_01795 [Chitinophagaceae bacterium]|nr:MAG: hypothetical protein EA412_01795 [Chitinophagaceae bacterium]
MKTTNPLRQRLVNLLYLLLIAYVVLIMPVEFIETYTDLNRSLERANYRLDASNEKVLKAVQTISEYDSARFGPAFSQIVRTREITRGAIEYLDEIKVRLVEESGGYNRHGHLDSGLDPLLPTRMLYRSGKASEIKSTIEEAKSELMLILGDQQRRMLDTILVTTDTLRKSTGIVFEWEKYYFDNVPLAAVVTILSKFQHDLRIAESAVMSSLHDLSESYLEFPGVIVMDTVTEDPLIEDVFIDKGLPGDTYNLGEEGIALVRLPSVSKKELESDFEVIIYDEAGRVQRRVQFQDGVARIELDTDSPGEKVVRGLVQKMPSDTDFEEVTEDGDLTFDMRRTAERPFEIKYEVKEQKPVINQEKFNNLYIGVDNPINIVKPSREDREYNVEISNGELHKVGDQYYARVNRQGRVRISLTETRADGTKRTVAEQSFVARNLPKPVAQIHNRTSGEFAASLFKLQNGLSVKLEDLDIDPRYRIIDYEVVYINGEGLGIFRESVQGSYFSGKSRELIDLAQPGDIYVFDNIHIKGPDGTNEYISPLIINIQ